ncbi:MAG: sugar transferase [Gemmatimonadota bacterium]|nr:sugar transferase [Gemmatimonadota bacterium]
MMKRLFDLIVALTLLVLASPLILVVSLLIKLTSSGPVFFAHRRCGFQGQHLPCLKFRTMVQDAEEVLSNDRELHDLYRDSDFKVPRDRDLRVTKMGHFLRYTHVDELPQLINVLTGGMSLVGPRPIISDELEIYGSRADELLSVRPGVFGVWTAQGKDRVSYPERADLELEYVRTRSFLGDLLILARNIPVLIWGQTDG